MTPGRPVCVCVDFSLGFHVNARRRMRINARQSAAFRQKQLAGQYDKSRSSSPSLAPTHTHRHLRVQWAKLEPQLNSPRAWLGSEARPVHLSFYHVARRKANRLVRDRYR